MNRIFKFLRSVLPADSFQLFFLAALVCFTIAPHLRWWPSYVSPAARDNLRSLLDASNSYDNVWHVVVTATSLTFILAASCGYFLCLWPTKRTIRAVVLLVLSPAVLGLVLLAGMDARLGAPYQSVLSPKMVGGAGMSWRFADLWGIGTGLHFALAGLLLATIFLARLALAESSLPLCWVPAATEDGQEDDAWRGCKRLVWFSIAACTFVVWQGPGLLLSRAMRWSWRSWGRLPFVVDLLLRLVSFAILFAIVLWMMGRQNRKTIQELVRFGRLRELGISVLIPLVVTVSPGLVLYAADRAHWAAYDFGKFGPPQFGSYLPSPHAWTMLLVFAAFLEEVIFRGVLQKQFVPRYGVMRGVFLIGVVWAAFHFYSDRYPDGADYDVLLGLFQRITQCLVMAFVLSWLTERSRSLLPATICHWLSNVGVYANSALEFPGKAWIRTTLWLLVAAVLFRLWPIEETHHDEAQGAVADPEPTGA